MASLIFLCTACGTERSIPLVVVPRVGLNFVQEIDHPCTHCFRMGLVMDPSQKRRLVFTGKYTDDWGVQIDMVFSRLLN